MILDHIEGLELIDNKADEHFDSCMALARLGEGLWWIYREVAQLEVQAQIEATRDNVGVALVGGVLANKPMGMLSCAFQWYAVSACNYAQLVGWLANRNTNSAKEYVQKVMPRLLNYRNKVAAHFAITDPRRDNEADLAASVMTHVVYIQGRLCAAALTPVVKNNGSEITVSRDFSWSLTLAHERLTPRYWPGGPPTAYQALRVPPGNTTLNISWSDLVGDGT
ncbi:MAG: hypothetical protein HW388_1330 [Dehalococcoidia bacterium]|nr:hypothetical protein [Dehalococcoidia bacterium]